MKTKLKCLSASTSKLSCFKIRTSAIWAFGDTREKQRYILERNNYKNLRFSIESKRTKS